MPVEVVYLVRHGFRMNWSMDPNTGEYRTNIPTPTGIPSDPQLASHGEEQAQELAEKLVKLDPAVDLIYSSPFYRCIQTIKPTVELLDKERPQDPQGWKVRVDCGIGEYFGLARFEHPQPASLSNLNTHFNFLDQSYKSTIIPNPNGESLTALHDRYAYALSRIIAEADADPARPKALLLCSHAAGLICIGRALTGRMPADPNEEDFRCGTCCMSKFVRRKVDDADTQTGRFDPSKPERIPAVPWRDGRGVQGGWDCTINGDCSFLEQGEERTWHFNGDESFIDPDEALETPGVPVPAARSSGGGTRVNGGSRL